MSSQFIFSVLSIVICKRYENLITIVETEIIFLYNKHRIISQLLITKTKKYFEHRIENQVLIDV